MTRFMYIQKASLSNHIIIELTLCRLALQSKFLLSFADEIYIESFVELKKYYTLTESKQYSRVYH